VTVVLVATAYVVIFDSYERHYAHNIAKMTIAVVALSPILLYVILNLFKIYSINYASLLS